jgi:Cellulase (glycosyl hydrolase family 5)
MEEGSAIRTIVSEGPAGSTVAAAATATGSGGTPRRRTLLTLLCSPTVLGAAACRVDGAAPTRPDEVTKDTRGPAVATAPPRPGMDGPSAARAFVSDLTMGVNIERNALIQAGRITRAQLQEYRDQGITHVRFFPSIGGLAGHNYPNVAAGALDWFFDAIERAIGAGLKVPFDLLDAADEAQMADRRVMPYLRACAERIAARNWDVARYAVGAANEYAGGTHAGHRARMHEAVATLRGRLPHSLLLCAGCSWGDPGRLMGDGGAGEFVPPPDDRILVQWHQYNQAASDVSTPQDLQRRLAEWATRRKLVTICGEWGIGPPDNSSGAATDYGTFPGIIDAAARGIGQQRPTFWTVTSGAWWRLNGGRGTESAALRPEIAAAIRAGDAHIRAQSWFQPPPGRRGEPRARPAAK